jgi:hypothetical protein
MVGRKLSGGIEQSAVADRSTHSILLSVVRASQTQCARIAANLAIGNSSFRLPEKQATKARRRNGGNFFAANLANLRE